MRAILIIITFFLFGSNVFSQKTNLPKSYSQVEKFPLDINITGIVKPILVYYINEESNAYFLPSFTLNTIQLLTPKGIKSITSSSGFYATKTGKFDASRKSPDNNYSLVFKLTDLFTTPTLQKQIVEKMSIENTIKLSGKKIIYIPNDKYEDSLFAILEIRPTKKRIKINLLRDNNQLHELVFPIEINDANLLDNQPVSSLRLSFSGQYLAEFGQRDFQLTADFLNSKLVDALTSVSSTAGSEKMLFIPLGGLAKEKSELISQTMQLLSIEINSYKNSNKEIEPKLVEKFIQESIETVYKQVDLSAIDTTTRIVFMLDNGIGIKTTMGRIKSGKNEVFNFSEDRMKSVFNELYTNKNSTTAGGGIEFFEIFDLGGDYSSSSESTTKREQLYETFKKNINQLKQSFEGDLPIVTSMDLTSIRSLKSSNYFNTVISRMSEIEPLPREFNTNFSLASAGNIPDEQNINQLSTDLLKKMVSWASSVTPFDPKTVSSIFDLNIFSTDLNNKFTNQYERNNLFIGAQQIAYLAVNFGMSYNLILNGKPKEEGSSKIYEYVLSFKQQPFQLQQSPYGIINVPVTIIWTISIDQNGKVNSMFIRNQY